MHEWPRWCGTSVVHFFVGFVYTVYRDNVTDLRYEERGHDGELATPAETVTVRVYVEVITPTENGMRAPVYDPDPRQVIGVQRASFDRAVPVERCKVNVVRRIGLLFRKKAYRDAALSGCNNVRDMI